MSDIPDERLEPRKYERETNADLADLFPKSWDLLGEGRAILSCFRIVARARSGSDMLGDCPDRRAIGRPIAGSTCDQIGGGAGT